MPTIDMELLKCDCFHLSITAAGMPFCMSAASTES